MRCACVVPTLTADRRIRLTADAMPLSRTARKIILCLLLVSGPGLSLGDIAANCASGSEPTKETVTDMHHHHDAADSADAGAELPACCDDCATLCTSGGCGNVVSQPGPTYVSHQAMSRGIHLADEALPNAPPDPLLRPPIPSL